AYTAIKAYLPELNERTWRRNWKPFYEKLVSKCYAEESRAEAAFNTVTK
ncbi:antitermination protein, partial [Xenorhabdus bovienii]